MIYRETRLTASSKSHGNGIGPRRYVLFWISLAILLIANILIRIPQKSHALAERPSDWAVELPGASGRSSMEPNTKMREGAWLSQLPEEERRKIEERRAADRSFFASINDLPESERSQKIQEYFEQNPPPVPADTNAPGGQRPPGPGGPAPNGSRGRPGTRLPEPDQRRSMDKRIADSQTL